MVGLKTMSETGLMGAALTIADVATKKTERMLVKDGVIIVEGVGVVRTTKRLWRFGF